MHLLKGNVGSGIFAMGDGIRNAGIIFGPIVVLVLGVICTHCMHLLVSWVGKLFTSVNNMIMPVILVGRLVVLVFLLLFWETLTLRYANTH